MFFIGDFYCHTGKTIIELDRKIHLQQLEYDKLREADLIEMGYKILRFKNEEVLYHWTKVERFCFEKFLNYSFINYGKSIWSLKTKWLKIILD